MSDEEFECRVVAIKDETAEIRSFELERADGRALPGLSPGAHINVHLGKSLVRQYSLCNGPESRDRYFIAVKREPKSRGGSATMHESIRLGSILRISGPRNHFELAEDAGEHLLIAGGIGITPLLSMARHLLDEDKLFQLKYFTRSQALTAFHRELSSRKWAECVSFHYAVEPDRLRGYLVSLLREPPKNGHVYVCGPRPFMDAVIEIASVSYPLSAIHSEYFGADPLAEAGSKEGFRVQCRRSDKEVEVRPEESIAEALTSSGIRVQTMCEQGVCGACLTGVLEGRPDHRDTYLTAEERAANDRMLICCSRSFDPVLVLDI